MTLQTTTQTEGVRCGEYYLSEGEELITRDVVTLTGGPYVPGQVLAIVTASGKYTAHNPPAAQTPDGTENAAGILYDYADASGADLKVAVTTRLCEVDGNLLAWKTGISSNDKAAGIAALAAKNIIVRTLG